MKVENAVVIKRDVSYVATKCQHLSSIQEMAYIHPTTGNLSNATSTVQKLNQLVPVNVDVELANKKKTQINCSSLSVSFFVSPF